VERKAMIDPSHGLPIARQVKALNISRGSVYYKPRPVSTADLAIMRRIDALHLDYPFAGSRMLRDMLGREGTNLAGCHLMKARSCSDKPRQLFLLLLWLWACGQRVVQAKAHDC
jgi:hypothetical protein